MIRSLALSFLLLATPIRSVAADYLSRLPEDEVIYFLLPDRFENGDPGNDRGGLVGDRLRTGFDPTDKDFYHGGDLKGILQRLDYIQNLGVTAIWVGPIFKNKPVQGALGHETAAYHGYWITDFTTVDPHFGTNIDFANLVAAAHARGMKIYMDIVVNHTADVIQYRECASRPCPYRSRADYPYTRRGGITGASINEGFVGDRMQTGANFSQLKQPDFAYTPYVSEAERDIKKPDWLNNPIYYHNRGDSTFDGESSTFGDFAGLDDLFTENPRVVSGFIDIFGGWIDRYKIDGFRIDTAKHVNPEFWQAFVPALLARAKSNHIDHFHMFGEAYYDAVDPALTARHTRVDGLPAVLDFPFRSAMVQVLAKNDGTNVLVHLFNGDVLYQGGEATALRLPTFISNHDAGRFATFVRSARPTATDDDVMARVRLATAMMFMLRGVPVIYAGDEQGFVGRGGDSEARQDMFVSRVAAYNDAKLLGTTATTARPSFDPGHPLYKAFAHFAALRRAHPALRRGLQTILADEYAAGLFSVLRTDAQTGEKVLIAFNTSPQPIERSLAVDARLVKFGSLYGQCNATAIAPGSYKVAIAPLDFILCAAGDRQ